MHTPTHMSIPPFSHEGVEEEETGEPVSDKQSLDSSNPNSK